MVQLIKPLQTQVPLYELGNEPKIIDLFSKWNYGHHHKVCTNTRTPFTSSVPLLYNCVININENTTEKLNGGQLIYYLLHTLCILYY